MMDGLTQNTVDDLDLIRGHIDGVTDPESRDAVDAIHQCLSGIHQRLVLIERPPESVQGQIDRLAAFILAEVPEEPSQSQGAVDTAIRLIRMSLVDKAREKSL